MTVSGPFKAKDDATEWAKENLPNRIVVITDTNSPGWAPFPDTDDGEVITLEVPLSTKH